MTTAFQQNAFQDNAFQIDDGVVVVTPPPSIDVYAPSGGGKKRRYRNGDDELTEAELQWMFRKIAELKKARADEQERIAKELEVALAQAAQDEEAAEVIAETIEEARPQTVSVDYSGVMRDAALLSQIVRNLQALLHEYQMREDDDIAAILLTT